MRPSYILKIEKLIGESVRVLKEEYINPFEIPYEKEHLYNLSSGIAISNDVANEILKQYSTGLEQMNFFKKCFVDQDKKLHSPISRNKIVTFKNISPKCTIQKGKQASSISVNRDIIGSLISFSAKYAKPIDWKSALGYPLSPIPLSLSTADGYPRKTNKAKLLEIILNDTDFEPENTNIEKKSSTFIIDLMAAIRLLAPIPVTYEELIWKLLKTFPKGYGRLDIVSDTYRTISIKSGEREKRGRGKKIMVKSVKSKIPRDFDNFLLNAENKSCLIELIFEFIKENVNNVCELLKCSTIFFSKDNSTFEFTPLHITLSHELSSNQEEADTKVIFFFLGLEN